MTMRRFLSALAVALVALSGATRAVKAASQNTLIVVLGYDLDSTTVVYPISLGPLAVPSTVIRPQAAEGWYPQPASDAGATTNRLIKTANFTSAVTSCSGSSGALSPLSTGDIISVNDRFNRSVYASIFQWTSANAATLDRSLDLTQSGCARYRWRKTEAGSAITDGWWNAAGYSMITVQVDVAQMVATGGVTMRVECMAPHSQSPSTVLASSNLTAVGSYSVSMLEPWDICRVGLFITGDSDATPSTDNEKISVFAIRRE